MLSVRTDCRSPQVCRHRTQKGKCRHHGGTEQQNLTVNANVTLVADKVYPLPRDNTNILHFALAVISLGCLTMCLPLLDNRYYSKSYHQQGQDDLRKYHQSHWQVKGHRIEGPIGVRFYKFTQQEDHPEDGKPNNPNHSWPFRLECQENKQERYDTEVQWGRKGGAIASKKILKCWLTCGEDWRDAG